MPVKRLKIVLLPAPFGPISARISPARTSKETFCTAARPPKCFGDVQSPKGVSPLAAAEADGAAAPQPARARGSAAHRQHAREESHQPAARVLQHDDDEHAEEDDFVAACCARIRSAALSRSQVRTVSNTIGPISAPPRWPGPADHDHEQIIDRRVHAERAGIDHADVVRLQPAGQSSEQRGKTRRPACANDL